MTVAELIAELQKLPADADVVRQMTAEWGTIEIESIRHEPDKNLVVID